MQVLMVILLSPLLLSALLGSQSITSSAGRPHLFWVAADKKQCSNYNSGSDCDTLDRYLGRKDVNFSLSDTTWIFLRGEHEVHDHMEIILARNVTLTGEEQCTADVQNCTIAIRFDDGGLLHHIRISKSEQITIEHLSFVTRRVVHEVIDPLSYRIPCPDEIFVQTMERYPFGLTEADFERSSDVVRISFTSDFCMNHVQFLSRLGWQEPMLQITNPLGHYVLMGSVFTVDTNFGKLFFAKPRKEENQTVTYTISQCRFESYSGEPAAVQVHLPNHHNYYSITMNITNTTFLNLGLNVEVESYPTVHYSMELNRVNFTQGKAGFQLSAPLSIQEQDHSDFSSNIPKANTAFCNCAFYNVSYPSLSIVLSNDLCDSLNKSTETNIHEFAVLNSLFEGNRIISGSDPFIVRVHVLGEPCSSYNLSVHKPNILLTLKQSIFKTAWQHASKDTKYQSAALFLKNLQGYRVVMAGENQIVSSEGCGLMLENSQVELQGYNEISKSSYARSSGRGIHMSSDSQLLLSTNSQLNVSGNTGKQYGGGIYVSHTGRLTPTLTDFVDCYIEKLTCPGWCFFQFINSDGQYVNASDIAEHNATVILSHNPATLGGNNVFNGHFENCSLQTPQGILPASIDLISTVFLQHPQLPINNVKESILSYPYFICLCDGDELNCIRNHTPVIDTYPVQQFPISVNVMGDWQQVLSVRVNVIHESETRKQAHQMDIRGCTKVYTMEHLSPGSDHHLLLEVSLANDLTILKRNLVVNVFNSCSSGLVFDQHGCDCNAFLRQHKFTCTIKTNSTTYRTELPHYWIGITGDHLTISPNCPVFHCNSDALQIGLTLDETMLNKQCINDRQGLLCSECPSGYSSVFGSFKCKECSSVWLLQIPLYALGGIFIVALLFLFNLTLLQGTIMGVVLHANIMGFMTDFLQEHAWGPLFFLLSVLNLKSGAGVCFYDGMDQFAKALLQFAFPFYLFTLLIVIIIVTHKCGYRMFRKARFIARRAVPVLATIMVLTYTSLVSTAIVPLRYTTLYNADTAQGETVWLHQPSLPFFGGQHLVLGILSIAVTVLYLIPFTFTMLFGDLMRRYFHKLWFSHFMDVLHGGFIWPLGFWIGLRLLLRVILVVITISTNPNTSAFCTLVTAGTLLVIQLLVKPFRDPNQFREDIDLQGPPSCKRKCLTLIKKFFNMYPAPLFDTLYLLNIIQTSAIAFGSNSQTALLSAVGVNILILMALIQFAVILVYHAYNFFPVPERARSCAQSCWSTMRAIPSMLKDTQCCRRGPREEEEPRRSPIPILILRPPEIDESYDSESETSSYNEQPPPEEMRVRESSLQEPLLVCSN